MSTGPSKALLSEALLKFAGTKFGCALFLVLLFNALLSTIFPALKVNASALPSAHTWEWWRARSFLKNNTAPDVVLMGSSLMMIPVSVLDADYLGKDLDAVYHDHSVYMEEALQARLADAGAGRRAATAGQTASGPTCFNFAIPGGMISDDYMIVRALMHGQRHPQLIVLGLTLRDFIESHVPCAASTTSFKYFKHFFDIDDIVELSMPEIWQRLDYWQSKMVYMVGQRLDIQVAFNQEMQSLCNAALGAAIGEGARARAPGANPELTANVAHNLKAEAEPGDFVLKSGQVYPYEDNSGEYRKRFQNPSDKLFKAESTFLEKLLVTADLQGSKVILVNMPLTPANMQLMPAGYYAKYLAVVRHQSEAYHCPLLDLNNGTTFGVSDFRDTAHMNASGGKKMLDTIVASIAENRSMLTALKESPNLNSGLANRKLAEPGAL